MIDKIKKVIINIKKLSVLRWLLNIKIHSLIDRMEIKSMAILYYEKVIKTAEIDIKNAKNKIDFLEDEIIKMKTDIISFEKVL